MADAPTPSPELERKLATILSADVAEYSRLMAEDEEGTLRTFRGHRGASQPEPECRHRNERTEPDRHEDLLNGNSE